MNREWKPGDAEVAIISWQSASKRHGGTAMALRCSRSYDESFWRSQNFGEINDEMVTRIRPLVVIDPEDDEQVERLWVAWSRLPSFAVKSELQRALREYANPTPPKPDEPTGLGAVVEDVEGTRWTRVETAHQPSRNPWYPADAPDFQPDEYDHITVVRVLTHGVDQ